MGNFRGTNWNKISLEIGNNKNLNKENKMIGYVIPFRFKIVGRMMAFHDFYDLISSLIKEIRYGNNFNFRLYR